MADSSGAPEDATVTFHVKSSGGQKYTFTLPLSTSTTDLKSRLATEEYANVPTSAQRLIYSGKVLKDTDTLASLRVKEGHTMHLVKSAASNQRQNPANQTTTSNTTSTSTPQASGVPQNLAAGTGNDPLAGLTGARYAGFAQLPSASMFQNQPTPEDMMRQLQDPNFAQMMREAMNNPQFVDMMINSNPQLRAMGPQARQMLQSDYFRRMMTDPEAIRSVMQMQEAMGTSPFGGGRGGQEAFPAPGVTNTTEPQNTQNNTAGQDQQRPPNPFAAFGGGGGMGTNPFASLFNSFPPGQGQQNQGLPSIQTSANPTSETTSTTQQTQPPQNPFAALFNPAMMGQQLGANPSSPTPNPFPGTGLFTPEQRQSLLQATRAMQGMRQNLLQGMPGGAGAGAGAGAGVGTGEGEQPNYAELMNLLGAVGGGGGGFGGGGFGAAPPDTRPPEERYATQLRQLNEMGFHDFDRNIQALSRSGGDVNGALEWLFSQT